MTQAENKKALEWFNSIQDPHIRAAALRATTEPDEKYWGMSDSIFLG